jgi:hypothetical protein
MILVKKGAYYFAPFLGSIFYFLVILVILVIL